MGSVCAATTAAAGTAPALPGAGKKSSAATAGSAASAGLRKPLVVHHRTPSNHPSALITLCRACHARLHRLRAIDRWVPDVLEELWAEQHLGAPRQLQLPPTRL